MCRGQCEVGECDVWGTVLVVGSAICGGQCVEGSVLGGGGRGGQCVEGSVGDSVGSSVAQVLPLHPNNNNKQHKKNVGQG